MNASLVVGLSHDDQALVQRAADWATPQFAGLQTPSGEPLIDHALGTAAVLTGMQADAQTRAAALLIALPEHTPNSSAKQPDVVTQQFGAEIGRLVQGTRALLRLGSLASGASHAALDSVAQKEMLRKMLLAMAADLRIVLLRLASRLQTLRWYAASKTTCDPALARETLDLYTPLASRLGIWQIKWEMEDLAFRFTDPARYKEIAKLLEEKRIEREAFIARTVQQLTQALKQMGVHAQVSGRPKHIYSIYNKMRHKNLDFSQLFDVRALRIIVPDERDCYTA